MTFFSPIHQKMGNEFLKIISMKNAATGFEPTIRPEFTLQHLQPKPDAGA
jgi:hypothetical protein